MVGPESIALPQELAFPGQGPTQRDGCSDPNRLASAAPLVIAVTESATSDAIVIRMSPFPSRMMVRLSGLAAYGESYSVRASPLREPARSPLPFCGGNLQTFIH